MTRDVVSIIEKFCYNRDLTYYIDSNGDHCICDIDWIARFKTESELLEYIESFNSTEEVR